MERLTTTPGSARVRPEDLLEHSVWLRRLASTLVRGDADAEDLVQDTYLAALRHPPLADRPVRGWLSEVARNAGRMRVRAEGRRVRREAEGLAGVDRSTPSADVLLGRLSAQRRLSELVEELAEPFRTTVLLRYFEGLSSAEIARRQRVPEGTVRWRLKTSLDRLRVELDRQHGGDRRSWCLLLSPLGDTHGGVMTMVKGLVKGLVQCAWGLGQATKMLVAAVMALACAGAWLGLGPGHGAEPATTVARAPAAAPARRTGAARAQLGPALRTQAEAQVERDEGAIHGAFEGRIINWSTGQGVPGAEVTFSLDGVTSVTASDEDGHFTIEPPRAGRSVLAMVTAAGYLPFAPEWGHSPFELFARPGVRVRDLIVQLVPALDYTGVVLDAEGQPVAGATVTLLDAGQGERSLHPIEDRFLSDERGEFRFHSPDNALVEARHPTRGVGRARMAGGALASHRLTVSLATGEAVARLGTERIAGRVVDAEGAPVAGALVKAHPAEKIEWKNTSGQTSAGADGRFVLEGLDPVRHTVSAQHAGYASAAVEGIAAGTHDVLLDLRRGGSLSGRVVAAEGGAPLPSFNVMVARREGPVKEISVTSRAVVDAEGRFTVPDLAPGEYRLRATARGYAPSGPSDVILAGTSGAPVELRLGRGGKLVGKLIEAVGGAPIEGARVSIESMLDGSYDAATAAPVLVNALTNAQGDFELVGVPPGVRSLTIGAYQHDMRIVPGLRFEEGITTGPVTLDLPRTRAGEEPRLDLVGLGVILHAEGDGLRIERVYPGSGAVAAGLTTGDTILAIDGNQVASLGMDDAIQRIRGPEGSSMRLRVRKADGSVGEVIASRRRIQT